MFDGEEEEEATKEYPRVELKVVSGSRQRRRSSLQNTKLLVTSEGNENPKLLPSVLLTFDKKFVQIGEKPKELKERSKRVIKLQRDSGSMESSDV